MTASDQRQFGPPQPLPDPSGADPAHTTVMPGFGASREPEVIAAAGAPSTVESVTCPECGTTAHVTVNRRDAIDFCRNCDYPLFWTPSVIIRDFSGTADDSLRRLPGARGRAAIASVPCPHCAELNMVSAETCIRCGRPMRIVPELAPVVQAPPPEEPVAPPPPKPDNKVAWWVWVLLALGVAVLAALIVAIGTGTL